MRTLNELAVEILADTSLVSWDGVRHVCRLLLAYADYNCAAADSKSGRAISDEPTRVIDSMRAALGELESVHEECERVWRNFRNAEWPRGAFEVWRANDETFCAALQRNTQALSELKERHFGCRTT